MPAVHSDRNIDLAHHHGIAISHVARITLDEVGANIPRSRKPCRIVEDAAVATIGSIPREIARTWGLGLDLVVHRQRSVAVHQGAECHGRIFR